MIIATNNDVQSPIAGVLGTGYVIIDSDHVPVATNPPQDPCHLCRSTGENRTASSDVLHLSQPHRAEPVELVEDLWLALQPLSHRHLG
jgi:hypothetical protein